MAIGRKRGKTAYAPGRERNLRLCRPSGSALKTAAVCAMLIDHFAAIVIRGVAGVRYAELSQETIAIVQTIYDWMRHIGRNAFPIFAFLIVEGFYHTRDRRKYAARLLLFAVLSEIPYDIAVHETALEFGGQNTLFTLLLGLLVVCSMERIRLRAGAVLPYLAAACGCALAYVCRLDYSWQGVLLIVLFYALRSYPAAASLGGFCVLTSGIPWSAPAFVLVGRYNGRRGGRRQKWLYYFYPLHLLALCGLRELALLFWKIA